MLVTYDYGPGAMYAWPLLHEDVDLASLCHDMLRDCCTYTEIRSSFGRRGRDIAVAATHTSCN